MSDEVIHLKTEHFNYRGEDATIYLSARWSRDEDRPRITIRGDIHCFGERMAIINSSIGLTNDMNHHTYSCHWYEWGKGTDYAEEAFYLTLEKTINHSKRAGAAHIDWRLDKETDRAERLLGKVWEFAKAESNTERHHLATTSRG